MNNFFNWVANNKLSKDFGVSALIAVLVIIGSFAVIIIGLLKELDTTAILPLIGGWVGSIVGSMFAIKSAKQASGK